MDFSVESSGPHAMADRDLCIAVGEDLQRHYPDHPWIVGCNHEAGTVVIDLGYEKPPALRNMAYLLHIPSLLGPGGHQRVMRAGGEWLERLRLAREAATDESGQRAAENGLDASGAVLKSKGSTV